MAIQIKNKWGYFVFFCLALVILYTIFNNYFIENTNVNYKYNIATLSKINSKGKGGWEYEFYYSHNKKKGRSNISKDSLQYYESKIGERFLVKINSKEWVNKLFFTSKLYVNKPVPDSIKEAPIEGWKELPDWSK